MDRIFLSWSPANGVSSEALDAKPAMPISMALPKRSARISGAHAMAVPWPPIRDAEPTSTLTGDGAPTMLTPMEPTPF